MVHAAAAHSRQVPFDEPLHPLLVLRIEASGDNVRDASWLDQNETGVGLGLLLLPLAGIAFLWFMGVVRHNFGEYEDQFYGTVFLGSGLLFLAMLFVGGATTGAVLSAYTRDPSFVATSCRSLFVWW